MPEFIASILAIPEVRTLIEGIVVDVLANFLHRRSVDPDFMAKSDAIFAQLVAAKTPEDQKNAQNLLRSLMSAPELLNDKKLLSHR